MGINISGNTDIISATDGSLTIQGADFTAIAAGSAAAPSISPTGDSDTGIFFPSADTIAIAEGGSEAFRINSNGHVGILSTLSIGSNTQVISSTGLNPVITVGSATTSRLVWGTPGASDYRLNLSGGGALVFGVDGDSENFGIEGHQAGIQHVRYLTIDNYGRVTMPYQPAFSVWRNTNQNIAHDTSTKVSFNVEVFDVGGNFDSSTNYRFTAPVAGKYLFMGHLYIYNTYQVEVYIYKNGSSYKRFSGPLGSGGNDNPNGMDFLDIVDLAVNDYVEIYGYHSRTGDTASQSIYGGSIKETSFVGYLIG